MSAIEGGHVINITAANDIIRQIVEARNRLRDESTDTHTAARCDGRSAAEDWQEVSEEIRREQSIEYSPPCMDDVDNPKDVVGAAKLPLHLWPTVATAAGCVAMYAGSLKYGRSNWRAVGVKASIYVDACQRHLSAWVEGEEKDPDDGVPHLSSALACLAILVDAIAAGKLKDDRQYPGGYREFMDSLTPHVARLRALHADKSPKHWTIADSE